MFYLVKYHKTCKKHNGLLHVYICLLKIFQFIIGKTVLCMWFGYFKNKHSSEWFLLWWSMKMIVLQWLGELWICVTFLCDWLILTLTNTVQYMNICLHNCAFLISFKQILSTNISIVNCCYVHWKNTSGSWCGFEAPHRDKKPWTHPWTDKVGATMLQSWTRRLQLQSL